MARITLGIGASHTPLLTLTSEHWRHRAEADYANKQLNMSDGRLLDYAQVLEEIGPRYTAEIAADVLKSKEVACNEALEKLADALEQAAPDIAIIVGDDQRELFSEANQPAIAVFHGDEIVTCDRFGDEEHAEWLRVMGRGYLMDDTHTLVGEAAFGRQLVKGLIDEDFDIASLTRVDNPGKAGFGHAWGFIIKRLFRGRSIPVVPLLMNTYYPPNVPSAARSYDLGLAVRRVVESIEGNQKVAVIASGGLSHFVIDEALDRRLLQALAEKDVPFLRSFPRGALNSGSSEILNWLVLAGALNDVPLSWCDYQPLFRTPAGTGTGAGFAIWKA